MKGPIFRLPPFTVQEVVTSLSETIDWGLKFSGVPDAWKHTKGANVRVAVLDTGIEADHIDLADAIDDARDFTRSPFGPGDRNGHGTHTAGIIGARENAGGVIGVAPECRLLVGKVLGDNGSGDGAWVAAGIDWACDQGAHVISMSLGSPSPDERIGLAIERAVEKGKFVLCAAGNSGRLNDVNYPARWKPTPGAGNEFRDNIAVAAFDQQGRRAKFSSRGPEVDVAAPGVDILSTYLNGGYAILSGTSMSTPFVAGVVALLVARHQAINHGRTPLRTMAQLREHLGRSSKDAGEVGRDDEYGYGLVDPNTLLAAEIEDVGARQPLFTVGGISVYMPAVEGGLVSLSIGDPS